MYKNKCVLSIISGGSPLREFGSIHDRKVRLKFNNEYTIRLKNKNNVDCAARVFIDGSNISNFGDVIVPSNSTVNLERFLTESLSGGKKFKFVSLHDSRVDDPYSISNGLIKVEFRMGKSLNIWIKDDIDVSFTPWVNPAPFTPWITPMPYHPWPGGTGDVSPYYNFYWSGDTITKPSDKLCDSSEGFNYCGIPGATIEGDHSYQSFFYRSLPTDIEPTVVLQLKLVGISNVKNNYNDNGFCTNCGNVRRNGDNFCGKCGNKF